MKFSSKSYVRCMLFANSTRNKRIGWLQLSKFINIKLKECLKDVRVLDKSVCDSKEHATSEIIMNAKKNGVTLFYGIEEESGKNANHSYVYFKNAVAIEARE